MGLGPIAIVFACLLTFCRESIERGNKDSQEFSIFWMGCLPLCKPLIVLVGALSCDEGSRLVFPHQNPHRRIASQTRVARLCDPKVCLLAGCWRFSHNNKTNPNLEHFYNEAYVNLWYVQPTRLSVLERLRVIVVPKIKSLIFLRTPNLMREKTTLNGTSYCVKWKTWKKWRRGIWSSSGWSLSLWVDYLWWSVYTH